MNRRGIIRIIEAVIAILIILGVLLFLAQSRTIRITEDLSEEIPPLLDEIARDVNLRSMVVENPAGDAAVIDALESFLETRIVNPRIGYAVAVCDANAVCGLGEFPSDVSGDIFAEERVITATLQELSPKKVKIFLWIRE